LSTSLWMVNLTSVQAAPKPTATPIPTLGTPLPSGTYYVSVSGNDTNPGTLALPWRHIQYALGRVSAGSTVQVLNGVYNEKVAFPRSGASGNYIILQNYAGHVPVIDGTNLPISGETGLVTIENKQYVKLIGFEIRNLKAGGVSSAFPQGISVRGNGAFIEIRNNKVHDIENSCRRCGAHGIAVYGRDPNASIHDIIIDGNEVYNGQFGWSESMVLNGNVEFFTVSNNTVHDNDNIGIDFIGFEGENPNPAVDRARDGTVTGNLVYNINSYGNPAYGNERSAGGIYVDGGTRILVERNIVHHSNIGIELASEHSGKNTSYITLRNNFFYNNTQAGISIGGYDTRRGSTENCVMVNNTLYNNFTQGDWGAELYIQFDTRNNIIKNNVIYANAFKRYVDSWSAVMTGNVVGYNLYYASGGGTAGTWIWKGVTYSTFAAYQAGSGNDANGLVGTDPLLVNPVAGDLHLQPSSPAIDRGQNFTESGMLDIDGQTRIQGPAIDFGADEVR
jgi:uncharacterized protein DUF1565/parallel beta helix pectate lyase-like protein